MSFIDQYQIASGKGGNGDGFVAITLRQFVDVDDFNIAEQISIAAVFVKNGGAQVRIDKLLQMLLAQAFIGRQQNGFVHFLRAIMAKLQNIDVHQQRFAAASRIPVGELVQILNSVRREIARLSFL